MTTSTAQMRARSSRVDVRLEDRANARRYRELSAFARYCVARIEGELGEVDRWLVQVAPTSDGFTGTVSIQDGRYSAAATARGHDGALAIWDAMCRLEQGLRESRVVRARYAELEPSRD